MVYISRIYFPDETSIFVMGNIKKEEIKIMRWDTDSEKVVSTPCYICLCACITEIKV